MARKLLLKAFLKDKADDYKIEVGSRTGYFFYGTKAEFMQFCKAGKGSDMKPLPLNRHIKEKYKSDIRASSNQTIRSCSLPGTRSVVIHIRETREKKNENDTKMIQANTRIQKGRLTWVLS